MLGAPPPDFVCIPTDLLGRLAPKQAEWCVENFRYNNIFDNAKAKHDLGFRYRVSFEQGARKCIDWHGRTIESRIARTIRSTTASWRRGVGTRRNY